MNNLLDHLMYQAGLTAQGSWDNLDSYDQQAILKFANLIITECVNSVTRNHALNILERFDIDPNIFFENKQ